MQRDYYDADAKQWSVTNRDAVVGCFDLHNSWEGYNNLFVGVHTNLKGLKCLDFGCGCGRNLSKYYDTFKQIDGVDISEINLENSRKWLDYNNQNYKETKLYHCNGYDLKGIPDNEYDLVISTITLQHICVHEIRFNYFKEFYRVLKKDGYFSAQMGFGKEVEAKKSVGYYENNYDAKTTNGYCDVRVESPDQLENDLTKVGFTNFIHIIGDTGHGDQHPNWIYFKVKK